MPSKFTSHLTFHSSINLPILPHTVETLSSVSSLMTSLSATLISPFCNLSMNQGAICLVFALNFSLVGLMNCSISTLAAFVASLAFLTTGHHSNLAPIQKGLVSFATLLSLLAVLVNQVA